MKICGPHLLLELFTILAISSIILIPPNLDIVNYIVVPLLVVYLILSSEFLLTKSSPQGLKPLLPKVPISPVSYTENYICILKHLFHLLSSWEGMPFSDTEINLVGCKTLLFFIFLLQTHRAHLKLR